MRRLWDGHLWIRGAVGVLAAAVVALLSFLILHESRRRVDASHQKQAASGGESGSHPRVEVIRPQKGGMQRTSDQPGSIEAFAFADLYGNISGYLKNQTVDIGSTVKVGQLLAEIQAPEYQQELDSAKAALTEARSQVTLKQALVKTAQAKVKVAKSAIEQAESELARAEAEFKFREQQYERIKHLFELKSIEERLVDEKDEQRHAAQAAEEAAKASIETTHAEAEEAAAKVEQANAEVEDARAKVGVAQAAVGRAHVFVDYTKIVSPYDGIVTRRSYHEGDFIRDAGDGGATPLLTVARTDVMRVVVQVPERDVPFVHTGDAADIMLDALPDRTFHAKVSRISGSEDRLSRSMRTEIDLENPKDQLRDGMFLRVTIFLDQKNPGVTVPSTCLMEDAQGNKTSIFVVDHGHARRKHVKVGRDDGVHAEILDGLSVDDRVVLHPGGDLSDGAEVTAEEQDHSKAEDAAK